jgi:hypothetical protein
MSFLERWNSVRSACFARLLLAGLGPASLLLARDTHEPTLQQAVQRFEHYELVNGEDGKPTELGRGAMGITYKAVDLDLHCPVTLKVISERFVGDESARLRFLREARAAASVRHQNVASVFHLGRSAGNYFYAMEFVEGETLEHLIKRSGRLDVKLALEIATQVAAGLAAVQIPKITGAIDARRRITRQSLQKTPSTASRTGTRKPQAMLGPEKISVARLPVTGSDVFGREEDIAFLDDAWANQRVNIVTIMAWAGVGKSTLVNHWLRRMATDQYRSAELIFGWSFYRQGTSGDTSSADEFLDAALKWFGDPDPRLGTAWEKGERLAKLVAHRRTLLVLDGLEPLQNPPGPHEGRVREPSLQALLRELAAFNTGLCVITTRTPVADIADHEGSSALRRDLERLSSDAGAKLLRALGVKGDEAELRSASNESSGHCLALTLLGSYLTDAYNGDIRCRSEVSGHLAHDVRQGVHARKIMESYQTWFGEGSELSVPFSEETPALQLTFSEPEERCSWF